MSPDLPPIGGDAPDRLRETLRAMIAHPDRRFRMLAMNRLLEDPPPDLATQLLTLSRDPYHGVRSVVAWALGKLRCTVASGRLRELLGDADPWVRKNAAVSLATLGATAALPDLRRLAADPDRLVRGTAVWAARRLEQAGGDAEPAETPTQDPPEADPGSPTDPGPIDPVPIDAGEGDAS